MAENVLRILANRFRCLLTTMAQEPHNVLACVTLHNIIRTYYLVDHQGLADIRRTTIRGRCQVLGGKVKFCLTLVNHRSGTMLQLQPRDRESI